MSELVMLCHKVVPRTTVKGMLMSDKLDGQRCFWDGGITRGLRKALVPWANCQKDGRLLTEQVSTGLWSRLGNVIHAPSWWIDQLPAVMLDGELWAGYEHRQKLMTNIKGGAPSFEGVKYYVYDLPPLDTMLAARIYNCGGGRKVTIPPCQSWYAQNAVSNLDHIIGGGMPFIDRYRAYKGLIMGGVCSAVEQTVVTGHAHMDSELQRVLSAGGEGLVLKAPIGYYATERSHQCLKYKPFEDSEAEVIGWTSGAETDKGSRLLGKMGSLRVKDFKSGVVFDLSGFTDAERELNSTQSEWARMNPGSSFIGGTTQFHTADTVTYKYRGLTADRVPMEARYWRERTDE